jgi:hypothetical protein
MASAAIAAQLRVLSAAFEGRSLGPTIIMTTLPGDEKVQLNSLEGPA